MHISKVASWKEELETRMSSMKRVIEKLDGLGEEWAKFRDGKRGPSQASDPFSSTADNDEFHTNLWNGVLYDEMGDWRNRVIIHTPEIQVSNTSRDILLKYYYSSRKRKASECQFVALWFLTLAESKRRPSLGKSSEIHPRSISSAEGKAEQPQSSSSTSQRLSS